MNSEFTKIEVGRVGFTGLIVSFIGNRHTLLLLQCVSECCWWQSEYHI